MNFNIIEIIYDHLLPPPPPPPPKDDSALIYVFGRISLLDINGLFADKISPLFQFEVAFNDIERARM